MGSGAVATGAFVGALAATGLAVLLLGAGVFPHAPPHDPLNESLLYYRDVASRPDAACYENEVVGMTLAQLNHQRAVEAYWLAKIAERKAKRTCWAFVFAGLFLLLWPAARVALALAN